MPAPEPSRSCSPGSTRFVASATRPAGALRRDCGRQAGRAAADDEHVEPGRGLHCPRVPSSALFDALECLISCRTRSAAATELESADAADRRRHAPDFIEVAPEDTLGEVAERMTEKNVGTRRQGLRHLIGILTERDLLKAMAARVHSSEARVQQWMTVEPVTASADTDVEEASRVMLEHGFRHLPVIDDQGQVIGVVEPSARRRRYAGGRRTDGIRPDAGTDVRRRRAYGRSRSRANSTKASAARVGVRPDARASEISRLASSPLTWAAASVPAPALTRPPSAR